MDLEDVNLNSQNLKTRLLGKVVGEQKLRVICYVAERASEDGFLFKSLTQICEETGVTKPTAIAALKLLEEKRALKPLKRGLYKIFL